MNANVYTICSRSSCTAALSQQSAPRPRVTTRGSVESGRVDEMTSGAEASRGEPRRGADARGRASGRARGRVERTGGGTTNTIRFDVDPDSEFDFALGVIKTGVGRGEARRGTSKHIKLSAWVVAQRLLLQATGRHAYRPTEQSEGVPLMGSAKHSAECLRRE